MFPEWTWVVGLFIGAAIGSFLNVVVYRVPRGMSLGKPEHSFCPKCKHRLGVPDLFPLLSWLFLRGRCRHCHATVPARYFFVELLTGGLWAGFWHQHLVAGWDPARAVVLMLFSAALVAAIFIDLEHYIIPDPINAAMLFFGLAFNGWQIAQGDPRAWTWGIPSSVAGALVGVATLWGIAFLGRLLFQKDAMGHGDIKMARGIGAVLLPTGALMSFALAVVFGAVFGILQILVRSRRSVGHTGDDEGEEQELAPESLGSLLKCGVGYVLCLDVVGLFAPKFYESFFDENPYAYEEIDDDWEVGETMIPFGPYLALGALAVALFQSPLEAVVRAYWKYATGA